MHAEFAEMASEIERIADATEFNGVSMLNDASSETVSIHVGTESTIDIATVDMTKIGLGIETGEGSFEALSADGMTLPTTAGFLIVGETNGANTDSVTFTIQFTGGADDETSITIAFDDTDGTGTGSSYTLQQVVDAINIASQNININDASGNTMNYQMAEAYLDSDNKYKLKISSRLDDAAAMTLTAGGAADADTDLTGTWITETADMSGTALDMTFGGDADAGSGMAVGAEGEGINILTTADAVLALEAITDAINQKDSDRATFGYKMNRLESTIAILDIQSENLMAAESRVSDVDVATEMATLTRTQVLAQAGISMLSQANQMPQMALSLLR
jgi:flagellin